MVEGWFEYGAASDAEYAVVAELEIEELGDAAHELESEPVAEIGVAVVALEQKPADIEAFAHVADVADLGRPAD